MKRAQPEEGQTRTPATSSLQHRLDCHTQEEHAEILQGIESGVITRVIELTADTVRAGAAKALASYTRNHRRHREPWWIR